MTDDPNASAHYEPPKRMRWLDDRNYDLIPTPYWCDSCGEQGLPTLREGEPCLMCGQEQHERFRDAR
jgi:hypothetical protein